MSQSRIFRSFLIHLLVVLVFIGSIGSILAKRASAAGFSLRVDPPITYIETATPQEISIPIKITNQADSPVKLAIIFKPFTAKNEIGEVYFTNDSLPDEFIKIIYKDKQIQDLTIAPNQTAEVNLQINIPKDRPDLNRDYYFSVIFQAENSLIPKTFNDGQNNEVLAYSQMVPAVATNVIFSYGPKDPGGLSTEFMTGRFYQSGPIPFKVRIVNNTPTSTYTDGEILIKNLFGQTVGDIKLPRQYVLSKTSRIYQNTTWPDTSLIGPYQAVLYLKTPNKTITRTMTFFAFPYRTATVVTIILWITMWVVIRIKHKLIYPHSNRPK